MKKVFISIISCVLVLFTVSFFISANADENTDANAAAFELFTKFYNDGSYKKDTKIYINENVMKEVENYFHSKVTILERTTYYIGDELWMSNGNGYSGYGTSNGELTRFAVSRSREKGTEKSAGIAGGMEAYYCTLDDFVKGTHNSTHVDAPITLNQGWESINGVLASYSKDVFQGYRLFTAPLWLYTEESKNYIDFSLATLEEEVLENKETKNNTRLVMKLWTSKLDSAKFNSTETFEVGDQTHYLFSKAYVYKDYITNLEGNGTENDPYLINSELDWATFGNNALDMYKYNGEYVKLNTNISVTEPIFKSTDYAFRGTLDGNEKAITATLDGGTNTSVIGYTGRKVSNNSIPTIKNLVVEGTVNGGEKTSGIVAVHYGEMENCINKATITSKNENGYVGGLVGFLCEGASIINSNNTGNVTGVKLVGGIAGFTNSGTTTVKGCVNSGDITGDTSVGGIIGKATGTLNIDSDVNNGNILGKKSATGTGIAGIVGNADGESVQITNCINKGSVTFEGANYNGAGIVAVVKTTKTSLIDNCVNEANITAGRFVAGIIANNYNAVITNCSNSGEIRGKSPKDGCYVAGICAASQTSATVTGIYKIRIYTSKTEFTEVEKELTGTIINCSNSGKIHMDSNDETKQKIGGIVGYFNQNSFKGVLTACYNSGEVIGTGQTGGIIGIAHSTTPAASAQYCYQLGNTVHNPSGTYATVLWNKDNAAIGTLVGTRSKGDASNICLDLTSSVENGLCAHFLD